MATEPTPEQRQALIALNLATVDKTGPKYKHPHMVIRSNVEAADLVIAAGWRLPVSVPEDLAEAIERLRLWIGPGGPGYYYPTTGGELESDLRTVLAAAEVSSRPVPIPAKPNVVGLSDEQWERIVRSSRPVPDTEDDRGAIRDIVEEVLISHPWGAQHPSGWVPCECGKSGGASYADHLTRTLVDALSRRPVPSQTPEPSETEGGLAPWVRVDGCFGHCDPEGWFAPCRHTSHEAALAKLDEIEEYAEAHGHPTFQDEGSAFLIGWSTALEAAARVGTTPEHTDGDRT